MFLFHFLNFMALLWSVAGNPLPTAPKPGSIGREWTFGSGHEKRQGNSCDVQNFRPGVVSESR
jgi:hypothetical protein